MIIDPAWEGSVQFYELVWGAWLTYIFLVLLWEKVLRQPLDEWRYVLVNFIGAGAFWINHYFQHAEYWSLALNIYTLYFLVAWYFLCVRGHGRNVSWQVGATAGAIAYTVAFIAFENVGRYCVDTLGYSEFWFMLASYPGFIAVIVWRGRRTTT